MEDLFRIVSMCDYLDQITDIVILTLNLSEPLIGVLDFLISYREFYICLFLESDISNDTEKYGVMSCSFLMHR